MFYSVKSASSNSIYTPGTMSTSRSSSSSVNSMGRSTNTRNSAVSPHSFGASSPSTVIPTGSINKVKSQPKHQHSASFAGRLRKCLVYIILPSKQPLFTHITCYRSALLE